MLTLVILAGSGGYMMLGLGPLDAVYQTVITISTVGYREVGEVAAGYQVFTLVLILLGVGTSLYTLSVLLETIFEGRLSGQFRRGRMQRRIDRMSGHVVLCGYGQVGKAVEEELRRDGKDIVIIDRQEDGLKDDLLVTGEATDDDVLLRAGLERAKTLVLALNSDVDNLFVSLTARAINPELFIVASARDAASGPKLYQAGADRVVNTHQIGGARIASLVIHPEVAEFHDVVMQEGEYEVRLAEIGVDTRSALAHRSIGESSIRRTTGATVLAIQREGSFITGPSHEVVLLPDDLMISLGTMEQLEALKEQAREG